MPFEELEDRQRAIWGSAPYVAIAEATGEIHGALVEHMAPQRDERWLDVATGTGGIALRLAALGADVTGLDLSPTLVETARRLAAERGLAIRFDAGDAEALPYADGQFDGVTSALGNQFAPDHEAVARELARVCRPGGRLGLACWVPDGSVAAMFRVIDRYGPPSPAGAGDPFAWGDERHVDELLGDAFDLDLTRAHTHLRAPDGEAVWQLFSTSFGPVRSLAESLEPERAEQFHRDWIAFFEGYREGSNIVQRRDYLLIDGRRR